MDSFNVLLNILNILFLTSCISTSILIYCSVANELADAGVVLELPNPDEPSTQTFDSTTPAYDSEKQDLRETKSSSCSPSRQTLIAFRDHIIERQALQVRTWTAPRPGHYPTQPIRQVFRPSPAPLRELARRLTETQYSSTTTNVATEKQQRATPPHQPVLNGIARPESANFQYGSATTGNFAENRLPVSISSWPFDPRMYLSPQIPSHFAPDAGQGGGVASNAAVEMPTLQQGADGAVLPAVNTDAAAAMAVNQALAVEGSRDDNEDALVAGIWEAFAQ